MRMKTMAAAMLAFVSVFSSAARLDDEPLDIEKMTKEAEAKGEWKESPASVRIRMQQEEQQATKPRCTTIRFTGVASANNPNFIQQALAEKDLDDILARNPIRCRQFGCIGIAYFKNHKAQIISWDRNFYGVVAPVDFNTGRRDIQLIVRRKDAHCAN